MQHHFNLYIKPNGDIIDLDAIYPNAATPHVCYCNEYNVNETDDLMLFNGWFKTSISSYSVIWVKRLTKKQKEVLAGKLLEWQCNFDYESLEKECGRIGLFE